MALTITTKEYPIGKAGYYALVADITSMADWTEIDTSTDGVSIFKKYNDAAGDQYVAIKVEYFGEESFSKLATLSVNNGVEHAYELSSGNLFLLQYINWTKWEGGFYAHCTSAAMPATTGVYVGFGLGFGSSMVSQSSKWCLWFGYNGGWFIASPGTADNSMTQTPVLYNGQYVLAHPLAVVSTEYAPDNVLYLRQVSDYSINLCGWCTWNGVRYYKNGAFLIPEEV